MPLGTGARLGCYEIVGLLGAGGMGEVYRATDTTLGRDVALKTLPERLTQDPERLARFRREAQVLAALNHPHIGAIYGLEEFDGQRVLVLEFVDGETLAARIARGPLPPDEVIVLAREIADALGAAHERGIVHRDLKPANIALTSTDRVKVLDFGLAKAADGSSDSVAALNTPTITSPAMLTQAGVVLGTAAYMSPEQAKGRVADRRSDVWAFGCVLFEMLSGRRAFDGEEVSDTLAAVLRSEPAWDALPPSVPPHVRALLKGCLEKNPRERISDFSIASFLLKQEPSGSSAVLPAASPSRLGKGWVRAAIVAGSALVGAAAAVAFWPRAFLGNVNIARFRLELTDGRTLTLSRRAVAVSPDGSRIAYAADGRIFIRQLADFDAVPLPGGDPGIFPVFSPDGQSLVFWADGALKQTSIAGGVPITVCAAAPAPFGLDWHTSGIIFTRPGTGIMRVSPDGGTPEPIVTEKDGLVQDIHLLPDSDTILFDVSRAASPETSMWQPADIFVQSIRTGQRKRIIESASDPHYLPTGQLLYMREGTLMLARFDVARKELVGGSIPLIEGVRRSGGAQFAVSDAGTFAYLPGPARGGQDSVLLYDRQGTVTPVKLPRGTYQTPRVSPDGKWLALQTNDGRQDAISIYELSGANSIRRLTYGGNDRLPVWSADGRHLAFQSDREGDRAIFWQPISGAPAERLTRPEPGTVHRPESWSGTYDVLLFSSTKDSRTTLWTLSMRDRKISRFGDVTSTGVPTNAVFRPDGRWVAYQAGDGNTEAMMWVQPFPATGDKFEIVRGGRPLWSPDGTELFYVPAPSQFMSVSVHTEPTFGFTTPVKVPRRFALAPPVNSRPFDILPDGRFVAIDVAGQGGDLASPEVRVVLNWFEELKKRAH